MLRAMRRLALVVLAVMACKKSEPPDRSTGAQGSVKAEPSKPVVTLRIAYGSEKKAWLEEGIKQFEAANPGIKIDAKPTGSGEAAASIVDGSFKAHVYSP